MLTPTPLLKAVRVLAVRLEVLEPRLAQADDALWAEYVATARALAAALEAARSASAGEFLSTRELAERLHVSPRTVRRKQKAGELRPALQMGRTIRWKHPA